MPIIQFSLTQFAQASAIGKIGIFFAVWVGLWLPIAVPLALVLQWHPLKPITVQQKLSLVASLYLLVPGVLWAAAYAEGLPFAVYGLTWSMETLRTLGLGLGIAVLGLGVMFLMQHRLGWIELHTAHQHQLYAVWLPTLLIALGIGGIEELVFRGFLFNQLQPYSLWVAAIVSSSIFALLHLVWNGRETLPQLPGLWVIGMVLVLARIVTHGNLGLAWGLHAGWVWGIACLDSTQWLSYTDRGPAWMTGFAHKPLAGMMGLFCLLGTAIGLFFAQ